MTDRKNRAAFDELLVSNMLEIGAVIALLDRKGVLSTEEVLTQIKSLQNQLAQRTNELPDQQQAFPQPYLNVQVENALVDRILESRNAAGLTAHQACYELSIAGAESVTRTTHCPF